ncbi:MAG: bifunctional proline dehydrogenase/L-glutamate gamma-semialdehyde dehydrogenase [Prevotellaceae bacterium]|jgi:RHH-type proline utilization regulon transcriptional repressor/proline dehydrogenase/delta 1-pyrroline-5-carboxylate dehydrogenase|nr:bifunctional proline dehydrogenase/L-glutamate gamma-semialdehyde dehydrogenase [Prevotellaceae bacterium]
MKNVTTNEVLEWARQFLLKAEKELSEEELKEQKKYAILVQNPNDKLLLSKMLDESSQIRNNRKLSKRIKILIERYGVPEFFTKPDAFLLRLFCAFGYFFDFIAVPIFKKRLRLETSKVILDEKPAKLNRHLGERKSQQIGQNVNLLGEVVLGDGEAGHRYLHYLEALKDPQINYISIKISGIYAQIHPLNYAQNRTDLCERLTRIYQQAIDHPYIDEKGVSRAKFVNLDMEEYKDTQLTLDVFKTVLSLPQFKNYEAGIVVQAYLPDAWKLQSELLDFAHKRVDEGGAVLKMRLVKGANLQMEGIISSLKGWENPVYDTKVETDANYLHLLDRGLMPGNAEVLHIGVASHNFFSIAYAHLLSTKNGVEDCVTFEMLEGMANHLPRVMRSLGKQIILYTPVVKDEHFLNAVSYLVRRMDENTGKDNFLTYSFNLKADSEQWNFLQKQFLEAYALKDSVNIRPKREQNRLTNTSEPETSFSFEKTLFKNEPDTNFDLQPNREWADNIRAKWKKSPSDAPVEIPVQLGDKEIVSDKKRSFFDNSQKERACIYNVSLTDVEQTREILSLAGKDASQWRKTKLKERGEILHKTAGLLAAKRGDLIGCMAAVTGKTFIEGDVEVSEAVDFCRYYPLSMQAFDQLDTVKNTPKGIILVISPWNFPLAIPVGGVAAALAGGNSVILKPATAAYPVAWEFAHCFWEAGVPKDALQLLCPDGREPLNYLTSHPSVKHIILTGGTDTAFRLAENNPRCPLSAETGGKNAIILTASGDRDHAIQNIVTSAFGNAGQKCSACSLLLLEKEVYNDPSFKEKLVDAVTSLRTGSPWEGGSVVGPMISPDNDKLAHALNNLETGEYWLVEPEFLDEKKYLLKPCVKWGVKPGSYTFQTELFAPLLAVVCIDSLEQGVKLLNSGEYGLTSGLQSLDESEQRLWKDSIEAGNLYINRGITGAIVGRQPFGGMKLSAFGGGVKAGGPNYVSCFVNFTGKKRKTKKEPGTEHFSTLSALLSEEENACFQEAVENYRRTWIAEFRDERDMQRITGERNTFRYLPLQKMALRIQPEDKLTDVVVALAAAAVAKAKLTVSINDFDEKYEPLKKALEKSYAVKAESEALFLYNIEKYERIRTLGAGLSDDFYRAAAKSGIYVANRPPLAEGRVELLHYVKEQSISFEYHRYGNTGEDAN